MRYINTAKRNFQKWAVDITFFFSWRHFFGNETRAWMSAFFIASISSEYFTPLNIR